MLFNTAMGEKKYFNVFTFTSYNYSERWGYISSDGMRRFAGTEQIAALCRKAPRRALTSASG